MVVAKGVRNHSDDHNHNHNHKHTQNHNRLGQR